MICNVRQRMTVNLEGLLSYGAVCHRGQVYTIYLCPLFQSCALCFVTSACLLWCTFVWVLKRWITGLVWVNRGPWAQMFVFIFSLFFEDVFMPAHLHMSDFTYVCSVCSLRLAGSPHFSGEASHGRRGPRLVHFMLNSVSISWLLPSLQQKSAERNTSPQKSSGFDRRSVQSFIPRPRATEHCQQTFHWNHIKPLLFPHFCSLSLSISLCLFISLLLYPLLPLSMRF